MNHGGREAVTRVILKLVICARGRWLFFLRWSRRFQYQGYYVRSKLHLYEADRAHLLRLIQLDNFIGVRQRKYLEPKIG